MRRLSFKHPQLQFCAQKVCWSNLCLFACQCCLPICNFCKQFGRQDISQPDHDFGCFYPCEIIPVPACGKDKKTNSRTSAAGWPHIHPWRHCNLKLRHNVTSKRIQEFLTLTLMMDSNSLACSGRWWYSWENFCKKWFRKISELWKKSADY